MTLRMDSVMARVATQTRKVRGASMKKGTRRKIVSKWIMIIS